MDATLLYELKSEMDRIYISGIRLAKNNQRITKLLPLLEKHNSEDVTYNDLILNLKKLIMPGCSGFVELLSDIHISLDYLLRLHGNTVGLAEDQTEQIPALNIDDITNPQHSFLELKPLVNALLGGEKNRLDVILKAREQKLLEDFRMFPYLNRALADKDVEIAEIVEIIIKEDLKEKMFPFLLNHFEYDDGNGNLRRFSILNELRYEGMDKIFTEILGGDVVSLQKKAIQYMSVDAAYADEIIQLSESPQKVLKEMAWWGLANLKTEKTERKLYELLEKSVKKKSKGDVELLARALSKTKLQYTYNDVLGQVKELFHTLLAAGKKADADHFNMLRSGISILTPNGHPEVEIFYLDILLNETYNEIISKKKHLLAKPAKMVSYAIIDAIQSLDSEQSIAFYKQVLDDMIESEWKLPYYKICLKAFMRRGDSGEQIYEMFAPYYLKRNIGVEDLAMLCGMDETGKASATIDCRWIDLLYTTLEQADKEESIEALLQVLNALEPVPSPRYDLKLIEAGKKTKKHLLEITSMIMKRDVEDKYEIVYSLIKYCHDQGSSGSNALRQLSRATYWHEFPKAYVAKFRDLKNAPKAIYTKIGSEGS